jgi:phage baseplate assembly protein W
MAIINAESSREYKDLDLSFNIHPVRKDINVHRGVTAVINSVKNLILTNFYERPFQPELGSNLRRLLFENLDVITASSLEREISQTITNFEPRVRIIGVKVLPQYDENGFSVDLEFLINNVTEPITITFFLERVR